MNFQYLPIGEIFIHKKSYKLFDFPIKTADADKEVPNEHKPTEKTQSMNILPETRF